MWEDFSLNEATLRCTTVSTMARGLIAVFLVFLIGNPMCCCALAACEKADSAQALLPACCREKENQVPPSGEHSDDSIACSCKKIQGVVSADRVYSALLFPIGLLPSIRESGTVFVFPAPSGVVEASTRSGPPGPSGAIAPFHILYGVFRC